LLVSLAATALACASCSREISATPGVTTGPGVTATPVVQIIEPPETSDVPPVDLVSDPPSAPPGDPAEAKKSDWLASLPTISKNPLAGCRQCHVDVEEQYVGGVHYKENVACTRCHGPSEGHIADENNEVKPDELFARDDVDRLCGECHECFREDDADPPGERKVCTECHGSHETVVP
jgi:hypothetical protein